MSLPSPQLVWRLVGQVPDVTSMCFSSNSTKCCVGTARGDLFVIAVQDGRIVHRRLIKDQRQGGTEEDPALIWFVSFIDQESSAVLFGQDGMARIWDLTRPEEEEIDDVCQAHRLSGLAHPGVGFFISTFHRIQEGGDNFDRSETRVFRLERESSPFAGNRRAVEMTFCQDLTTAPQEGGGRTLWHGIGISSRWALTCPVSVSRETPVVVWEINHGIPLRRIVSPVFTRGDSSIESCYVSTNGQRCLLVSDTTGEICLLDLTSLLVVARHNFNRPIQCECLSADGSMALFRLDSEDDDDDDGSVFVWDFFARDRERMVEMCRLGRSSSSLIPNDVLKRVKRFLF